jgi:hypothetical protein
LITISTSSTKKAITKLEKELGIPWYRDDEHYWWWTCPMCDYETNEEENTLCDNCDYERWEE